MSLVDLEKEWQRSMLEKYEREQYDGGEIHCRSDGFKVEMGLDQELVLSPFLFAMMIP